MEVRKKIDIRSYILVFALAAIWIVFEILTKGTFLEARNLSTLFRQTASIAIIAVGMVLLIVAGHIDLSVGSIVAFTGAVSAIMQSVMGVNTVFAIIVPIAVGVIFAAWNGYWATYQKIPPFIVTLAGMQLFRSLTLIITNNQTISGMKPSFLVIGQGYLSKLSGYIISFAGITLFIFLITKARVDKQKKNIAVSSMQSHILKMALIAVLVMVFTFIMNQYKGIPVPVIIMIVAAILIAFVSMKTRFGRRLYAIGGNPEAAKLSGINLNKEVMRIYMLVGALSAVSGLILTARLDAATTNAGISFEFSAISAAVIGGTSFMGGEGTVFGAIVGSLIMASLTTGMSLLNVSSNVQGIFTGIVLLIAVWFDILARKKGRA